MCGRFALVTTTDKLNAQFNLGYCPAVIPRFNIAPSQPVLFILQTEALDRHAEWFQWGLVPFFSVDKRLNPPIINARAETLAIKPAFREAFKRKRGLVVMSGFYEWQRRNGVKQPYLIKKANNDLLAIAGLWDTWQSPNGDDVIHSGCVITTAANAAMQAIHNRMPVILNAAQQVAWLDNRTCDPVTLLAMLNPYAKDDLQIYPVTTRVNNWRYNEAQALQPIRLPKSAPRN